ncbi:MAG: hypothetical protein V1857_05840 [archaeon]
MLKSKRTTIHMMTLLRMAMSDVLAGTRGRPRAPWLSVSDVVSFNYLARVSRKNDIEATKLLECIRNASVKGESSFGDITITLRQMIAGEAFFLITQQGRIMAQVKLTSQLLEYLGKVDLRTLLFEYNPIPKRLGTQPEDLMIKDLNSQTRRFNIDVKVTEKSMPKIVFSKWGGGEFLLSTATVTDESGTIKLPLWNQQTSTVSVGDLLHIENARVKRFRGELQIRVGRAGTVQVVQQVKKNLCSVLPESENPAIAVTTS